MEPSSFDLKSKNPPGTPIPVTRGFLRVISEAIRPAAPRAGFDNKMSLRSF
jgi:hypothetical protein